MDLILRAFKHKAPEPEKPEVGLKHDYTFGPCKKMSETYIYICIYMYTVTQNYSYPW